jgi:hypothetical protein
LIVRDNKCLGSLIRDAEIKIPHHAGSGIYEFIVIYEIESASILQVAANVVSEVHKWINDRIIDVNECVVLYYYISS